MALVFSVIVPTHDRPRPLARCLEAIARQDHPREEFEVVVVDDGSRQPLDDVVAPYREPLRVALHRQERAGPSAARNAGARHARGEMLAFLDDDCVPAPGWLAALGDAARTQPGCLIGGRTVNPDPDNLYATASQYLLDVVLARSNSDPGAPCFFASNNVAVPAEVFREVGGFDTRFQISEDREFCHRWRRLGKRLAHAPGAVVAHRRPGGLRDFVAQHAGYGRGALRFHRLARVRDGVALGPDFALIPALLRHVAVFGPGRGARVLLLLAVSQMASVVGYVREAAARPRASS